MKEVPDVEEPSLQASEHPAALSCGGRHTNVTFYLLALSVQDKEPDSLIIAKYRSVVPDCLALLPGSTGATAAVAAALVLALYLPLAGLWNRLRVGQQHGSVVLARV